MRKVLLALTAVAGLGVLGASASVAAPTVDAQALKEAVHAASPVQEARLFCYNRMTGRFLHWGRCAPVRRRIRVPRVYCKNRFTGRFLYWGACR